MKPRDAIFLGLGALAYPLGTVLAKVLAHQPLFYPTQEK